MECLHVKKLFVHVFVVRDHDIDFPGTGKKRSCCFSFEMRVYYHLAVEQDQEDRDYPDISNQLYQWMFSLFSRARY